MKVMVFFQSTTKREMPYADPERQREAVKVWQQSHPEKLKAYRKTMFMRNSIAKHRFPKQRSIQQHGLTDAEVIHLVENVLASLRASTEDIGTWLGSLLAGPLRDVADLMRCAERSGTPRHSISASSW